MSKLFVYMHKGKGGCGKPAFYLTARPQPGVNLASDQVITVNGELPKTLKRLPCGSCGKDPVLTTSFVKPVTTHQAINLFDKALNRQVATQRSAEALFDNLMLVHELLCKVHQDDVNGIYAGSALQATIEQLLGLDEKLDQDLMDDRPPGIVDADGQPLEGVSER